MSENDPGLKRMYAAVKQYDDGIIRTMAARKKLEIAELELVMAHSEPTRAQQSLLTYLKEDCMVYETLAYILSVPEEEFESVVNEVGPAMVYEPTPVPRSVMDSYRRGLSDLEMKMEDRACGYADDLLGILRGDCTNY